MKSGTLSYDVIVIGGGIAGLWLAARLRRAGYNVILFEKDTLGGAQTLASQGMIHGGQKYNIGGAKSGPAAAIAQMPARWDAALEGRGEIDLSAVKILSDAQMMWAAGSALDGAALFAAAKVVNAQTEKMSPADAPDVFKDMRGSMYRLPEKVVDAKSLVTALAALLEGRVFQGLAEAVSPAGTVVVNGQSYNAKAVVFTAGAGNEDVFKMLNISQQQTQRRPLRQVIVSTLQDAVYGHGVTTQPKPRVTITSHAVKGGYVWYLGGGIAEKAADMDEDEAVSFAQKEMAAMFPHINWDDKTWHTHYIDRAEPFDAGGNIGDGPHIQRRGSIYAAWPMKMTFAPMMADMFMQHLQDGGIVPELKTLPPPLPAAQAGRMPWEDSDEGVDVYADSIVA